ncbi:MAG: type II secretion system F family protein, partial [Candidatus Omnitrophica bacterium]|nr:type II secretion system F family protein [Candidatus Omnitrophota bacterium]
MLFAAAIVLMFISISLLAFLLTSKRVLEEVTLPPEMKGLQGNRKFDSKDVLNFTAKFTDRIVEKSNFSFTDKLKKKLFSAGRPMNVSQFIALKFILTVGLPAGIYVLFHPEMPFLGVALAAGFFIPDMWLNGKIKKRKAEILKDLPYVIDLLNICVGAGLDFMVAVNHVIKEFRACVLIDELQVMVREIQMGLSRRDALKNLAGRVKSQEVNSFVRTLLQADRMGTPITTALKMHAEELRDIRFQRGEEMALKAPIKLLAPLLLFILPVVLIIVAGPILIQFTQGGNM